MKIRKYQEVDRGSLVALWTKIFPDDPHHNEPSSVIDAKLAVDDLIFVAERNDKIVGACIAGYDGHRGVVAVWRLQKQWIGNGIKTYELG
jgi:hypothetical protein